MKKMYYEDVNSISVELLKFLEKHVDMQSDVDGGIADQFMDLVEKLLDPYSTGEYRHHH